jgi:hypothetical protein
MANATSDAIVDAVSLRAQIARGSGGAVQEDMRRGTRIRRLCSPALTWAALGVGLAAGVPLSACQAVLGLGDYEIEPEGTGGRGGAGGIAGRGGSGGGGAGQGGDAPDAGGSAGSGCGGSCDPSFVAIQGTVHAFDTGLPVAGVLVEAAGGDSTTDAQGRFLTQSPPGELQSLRMNWPVADSAGLRLTFRRTVLAFEAGSLPERTLDVPAVRHTWLEDVVRDCGLLPPDAPQSLLDSYFDERNTILVDVRGENAAGITREQIDVYVESDGETYANFGAPDATDQYPPSICFLERGDAGGVLRGGSGAQTATLGQFVIFRVRNRAGSGRGTADVRIVNFGGPPSVVFEGAGLTGAVRIGGGW